MNMRQTLLNIVKLNYSLNSSVVNNELEVYISLYKIPSVGQFIRDDCNASYISLFQHSVGMNFKVHGNAQILQNAYHK